MSNDNDRRLIEHLSESERAKIVHMLTRYIIEKRRERVRQEQLKKI